MILSNFFIRSYISIIIILYGLATGPFITICSADVSLSTKAEDSCPSTDPNCNLRPKPVEDYKLNQLDGVKVPMKVILVYKLLPSVIATIPMSFS